MERRNHADASSSAKTGDRFIHGKRSILVVDDDPIMLEIIKAFLQDLYRVTTVASGQLALRFLFKQSVDLILLDYMMPDMDGPAVLQRIRKDFPELQVPVIFLTGVADKELVVRGLELHPKDYLLKPVKKEDLLERVAKVLAAV